MSVKTIARVAGGIVAFGIVVGVFIKFNVLLNKNNAVVGIAWENLTRWWWILAVILSVVVALIITPSITIVPYRWARDKIRVTSASDLVAAAIGLIVGLVISALLTITLTHLPDFWGSLLSFLAAILFCYLSVTVAVVRKNDLAHLFQSSLFRRRDRDDDRDRDRKDRDKEKGGPVVPSSHESQILLDTSTIIDGRIADITHTGFIFGVLVVPRFVLNELQRIADSADTMRRNRGRRGLEILNRLQKDAMIPIEIIDADVEGIADVDSKLVKMARDIHCPIITNDFNLNRVAELQGVKVLNINELANAIKPVLLPGEDILIKIMQDGKELGQGVCYLDDGTMIVVENGRQHMNATVEVTVTRVLQTVAGRMIFAHPKQASNLASSPQSPAKQRQA